MIVRIRRSLLAVVMSLALVKGYLCGQSLPRTPQWAGSSLTDYVKRVCDSSSGISDGKKRVVIFTDFLRFGCLPCLNAFFDFSDSLEKLRKSVNGIEAIMLLRRDNQEEESQIAQMRSWIGAAGLTFQFRIIPAEVFSEFNLTETTVMIIDRDGSFEYVARFPLTTEDRRNIMERLSAEGTVVHKRRGQ